MENSAHQVTQMTQREQADFIPLIKIQNQQNPLFLGDEKIQLFYVKYQIALRQTNYRQKKKIRKQKCDRGLLTKIFKEFSKLKKKKWAKDHNRHHSNDVWMANQHTRRCSMLYVFRELEIKTTM